MQRNTTKKYTIILLSILLLATAFVIYIRVQKTKAPQPVAKSTSPIGDALQVDTDQLIDQLNKQGRSHIVGAKLLIIQNENSNL